MPSCRHCFHAAAAESWGVVFLSLLSQLEGSGKWPDAPEAIQRAKLAFLLHLGQCVEAAHGAPCVAAEDAVDVLWAGFAFRMSIAYDRDPTLLKSAALLPALRPPSIPRHLAADVALRSLHAGLMLSLQGHHPIFAPIARLAKRWVGAHMLAPILCAEAVELLVASLFTRPDLYSVPRSRVTGLLRSRHLTSSLLCLHAAGAAVMIIFYVQLRGQPPVLILLMRLSERLSRHGQ